MSVESLRWRGVVCGALATRWCVVCGARAWVSVKTRLPRLRKNPTARAQTTRPVITNPQQRPWESRTVRHGVEVCSRGASPSERCILEWSIYERGILESSIHERGIWEWFICKREILEWSLCRRGILEWLLVIQSKPNERCTLVWSLSAIVVFWCNPRVRTNFWNKTSETSFK